MLDNYDDLLNRSLGGGFHPDFPEDCLFAVADDPARFKAFLQKIKTAIKDGKTSEKRFKDYLGNYKHYIDIEGYAKDPEVESFLNSYNEKSHNSRSSNSNSDHKRNSWGWRASWEPDWNEKAREETKARHARDEKDAKDLKEGNYRKSMTQYHNKVRGTKVAGAAVGGTVGGVIANKLAKKATNNMKSKAGKKAIRVVSTVAGIAAGGYGGYKAGGKIGKKIFKKPSYQSVHCDEQVMYSVGKRLKARARREYYGLKGMYGGSDAASRNRRNDLIATSAMGSIAGAAMGYGVTKKAKNKSAAAIKDRRRRVRKNVVIGALVGTAAGAGTAHALHRSDLGTLIGDRPSIGSFDLNTSVHRKLDFQDMVHKGRYGEKERLRRAGNRKGWKSGYSL